jgi:predicted dehydrogenase/threonine dehydrogenase-like Zn-dependent dehydrogenase
LLQIIQYQKTGDISVEELPAPQLRPGGVLVRNVFSLISAGTERMSVETAQASVIGKARSRPDLVRQVIENSKREGLVATWQKVQNRLDNYKDLGYSSAGIVVESACDDYAAGDRVACGGVGYAAHAEFVFVPRNLVARVPDGVGLDEAAFTTVASIAMQGVRQADVRIGERVVVVGLGLVGLLMVQLLRASGCAVFGLDIAPLNLERGRQAGCDDVGLSGNSILPAIERFTKGYGADAVVIAAATRSSDPLALAVQCVRKKGRVVVVGVVGMDVPHSAAYAKELDIRMSCSYGPGRYDADYEVNGHDYPQAYVRWTENRNMGAVLDLIAGKRLAVGSLVTHRFPIGEALKAYSVITGKTTEPYLGVLISYPQNGDFRVEHRLVLKFGDVGPVNGCAVGVIGAGNHTQSYLLPPLQKLATTFETVVTSKPVNAKSVARKFGFRNCATAASEVCNDSNINLVLIGSRHDSHAQYVLDALRAGKHVFVEKPLAITPGQLDDIIGTYNNTGENGRTVLLMVGYNRRFSAPVQAFREFFRDVGEPLAITYRVNAGFLPKGNWYQDSGQGGRVIGEIGHFLDTLQFITGSAPTVVFTTAPADEGRRYSNDNMQISVTFANGSVGHISYLANGSAAMPKEYIEASGGGKSAIMDNFKRLTLFSGRGSSSKSYSGDKGHAAEMKAVVDAVCSGKAPISMDSLIATSRASFAILESLRDRKPVAVLSC